jgi:hypothetical protein
MGLENGPNGGSGGKKEGEGEEAKRKLTCAPRGQVFRHWWPAISGMRVWLEERKREGKRMEKEELRIWEGMLLQFKSHWLIMWPWASRIGILRREC